IPASLSKEDVLGSGKRLVFWKDRLRLGWEKREDCARHPPLAALAYYALGPLGRSAEDRTFLGSLAKTIERGRLPRITETNIVEKMVSGASIINLDNFVANDIRQQQLLWSWNKDMHIPANSSCA